MPFSINQKEFINNYWDGSFKKQGQYIDRNKFIALFKEKFPECTATDKQISKQIEKEVYKAYENNKFKKVLLTKRSKTSDSKIENALAKIAKFHQNRNVHSELQQQKEKEEETQQISTYQLKNDYSDFETESDKEKIYYSETESDNDFEIFF